MSITSKGFKKQFPNLWTRQYTPIATKAIDSIWFKKSHIEYYCIEKQTVLEFLRNMQNVFSSRNEMTDDVGAGIAYEYAIAEVNTIIDLMRLEE